MKWKEPGKGVSRTEDGPKRIVIGFDSETFDQVRELAKKSGTSFAEQTRQLVEFGLETVESAK
jgi:hypothetical protein